ncbi:MAG: creatininase family protein [Ardenticatenaceae bacterium]|nr:creatininase family protein [Ardenticatenaceae bacterium]HBY95910.1 creatinine amidohydrolase [Chloroflexota bacterium]
MTAAAQRKILWQEMRRPELEEMVRRKAVVAVPFGAIEQHGPHLPVDTDSNQAWEICVRAAQAVDEPPVIVAPMVWSGFSPHHLRLAGALSLRLETFIALVTDLCTSIDRHGFRKIVLVNAHGGNSFPLTAAAMKLMEEYDLYVAVITYWRLITNALREGGESGLGGMAHAGEMETSLQLYLRPELVNTGFMPPEYKQVATRYFASDMRAPGKAFYMDDFAVDTTHGVVGDPSYATAEKGARFLNEAVAELAAFIREFAAAPDKGRGTPVRVRPAGHTG